MNQINYFRRLAQIIKVTDLAIARERCPVCGSGWSIRLRDEDIGVRCLRCKGSAVTQSIIAVLGKLPLNLAGADACELSALGPMVRYLAPRARSLATSEFIDGATLGAVDDGLRCENVEQLTYADASFDLCTSTEVFEHVADDRRGYSEILRVLRPGGWLVFSVPLSGAATTQIFCYRNYGDDIIERLREAGFHDAHLCDPGLHLFGHSRRIVVAQKPMKKSGVTTLSN